MAKHLWLLAAQRVDRVEHTGSTGGCPAEQNADGQREAEAQQQFEIRQEKRREKHRGH